MTGPYLGVVVANKDPAKLGRVKVDVPHVFGVDSSTVSPIGVTDLPWAIPAGLPAGGSSMSGGIDWLPDPGDQVVVFFLDGEPEKPVWFWMMQTLKQADPLLGFPLHHYNRNPASAYPDRAALTRYGHTLEINSGSMIMSTKSGYQVYLLDGLPMAFDGSVNIRTPRFQSFELDDLTLSGTLNILRDCYFNIGMDWQVFCADLDFTALAGSFKFDMVNDWNANVGRSLAFTVGTDATVTVGGSYDTSVLGNMDTLVEGLMNTTVIGSYNISFEALNLGAAATEPYVLGNRLLVLLNRLLVWLSGHAHSNGNNGSPTGPPLTPPQPELMPLLNTVLSTVIKGQ